DRILPHRKCCNTLIVLDLLDETVNLATIK
ncbi:MAG: hypothetical protein ACI8W9_000468, partial [Psychromonas sp.]